MQNQEFSQLIRRFGPRIALWGGIALVLFLAFGKFFLYFAGKAVAKIVGLVLIGIGTIFGLFRRKKN
jgi:hypothetical protein